VDSGGPHPNPIDIKHENSGIRIVAAQLRGSVVLSSVRTSPSLPSLNVGPFEVEEGKATHDVVAALQVQVFGRAEDVGIVRGVACWAAVRSGLLRCASANNRTRSCRLMRWVVSFHSPKL
jgi:hypothetical protein